MLENKKMQQWEPSYVDRGFIFTTCQGNPMQGSRINKRLSSAAESLNINKKSYYSHTKAYTHKFIGGNEYIVKSNYEKSRTYR